MTIRIHHKLKPFSHKKGAKFLIPGSTTLFTVYPTQILFEDALQASYFHKLELGLAKFYKDFTVECDFEKNVLRIFGETATGFVELEIYKKQLEVHVVLKRFSQISLRSSLDGMPFELEIKKPYVILKETLATIENQQKIDFGVSKKQDLLRINQDKNLKEYLPFIFRMGSSLQLEAQDQDETIFKTIQLLKKAHQNEKTQMLEELIWGHYDDLVPSVKDTLHQGLSFVNPSLSCLYLNQYMYEFIRSFLADVSNQTLYILKGLPKQLVAGKVTGLKFDFGYIHLEWTKGFIRQMILEITNPVTLNLEFSKDVKAFRVRKGKKLHKLTSFFEPGVYHFDNFQA